MSPLLLLIPLGGALTYVLVSARAAAAPPPGLEPPPAGPLGASSPIRRLTYMQRIDAAALAWRGMALIPGVGQGVLMQLIQTLEVVRAMAAADAAQGRLTDADLAAITAKIDAVRAEIAGKK